MAHGGTATQTTHTRRQIHETTPELIFTQTPAEIGGSDPTAQVTRHPYLWYLLFLTPTLPHISLSTCTLLFFFRQSSLFSSCLTLPYPFLFLFKHLLPLPVLINPLQPLPLHLPLDLCIYLLSLLLFNQPLIVSMSMLSHYPIVSDWPSTLCHLALPWDYILHIKNK